MKIESKTNDSGNLVFDRCLLETEELSKKELMIDKFDDLKAHLEERIHFLENSLKVATQSYRDLIRTFDKNGEAVRVPDFLPFQGEASERIKLNGQTRLLMDIDFDNDDRMTVIGARVNVPGLTEGEGEICRDPKQLGMLFNAIRRPGIAQRVDNFVKNAIDYGDFSEAIEYADSKVRSSHTEADLKDLSLRVKQLEVENPERARKFKEQRAKITAGNVSFKRRETTEDEPQQGRSIVNEKVESLTASSNNEESYPKPELAKLEDLLSEGSPDAETFRNVAEFSAHRRRDTKTKPVVRRSDSFIKDVAAATIANVITGVISPDLFLSSSESNSEVVQNQVLELV